ncbi:copper amine oxidase N-terminal domain-containing protein [Heliorestis acidaminivorans]|uniref:Copper amine oxidase N-terminal domain-containing protein n=1 Tax=Heliorestis acidaminivorans TaxID=553427 RepID=A0A6I0F1H4_9FIRM|nr:copper amine oxidase N-terminal domain-containing protein [Heliorestis acidaminivorans]KAB2953781.1 copper amine oxidase N-terminal domain-containing protein [Heliorestis acidaminivorans]
MFRKNKKSIALMVTLMFVLSMILPMAAFASVKYTATVTGETAPNGEFNARVVIEISENSIKAQDNTLLIRFPANTRFADGGGVDVTDVVYDEGSGNEYTFGTEDSTTAVVQQYTLSTDNDPATNADKVRLIVDIDGAIVPSGHSGDFKVTFEAPGNSVFSNAAVTIATVGEGTVNITIDDVLNFSSSGIDAIEPIRLKEDRPGAFKAASDSVKFKLPQGFTWVIHGELDDEEAPEATTLVTNWGSDNFIEDEVFGLSDNERTLELRLGRTTEAAYLTLSNLGIAVDESIARKGDVAVTISGKSSTTPSTLVVGRYGDFEAKVTAFGDTPTLLAGRADEEIGKFVIEELLPDTLVVGRSITFALPENTRWSRTETVDEDGNVTETRYAFPQEDAPNSDRNGLYFDNARIVDSVERRIVRFNVTENSVRNPGKFVFEQGEIEIAPNFRGDLVLEVGGNAGVSGKIVVGKVVPPVYMSADSVPEVKIGLGAQEVSDLIITESMTEALMSKPGNRALRIYAPNGVSFASTPKFEVIEGDLVLEQDSVTTDWAQHGREHFVAINVKATSTTPSKIKVSNVKLNIDRTVPEGDLEIAIKSNNSATSEVSFPSSTVAKVAAAKVVTPAPGEMKRSAEFKVNETTYFVNGVEKTMDVAPYIKDGRTFLPVRYVAEALGIANQNIVWDGANSTVTLIQGATVVQVTIGSNVMTVNGAAITMDVAPEVVDPGRVMLPLRFIAERFGAVPGWDAATQTVTINMEIAD